MLKRMGILLSVVFVLTVLTSSSALAFSLVNVDGEWTVINNGGAQPACLRFSNSADPRDENIVAYGDTILIFSDAFCRATSQPNLSFQSGFGFNGSDGLANFAPGQAFLLGEFRHYNQPLYPNRQMTTAQLQLNLDFTAPLPDAVLNYTFRLTETTNFPPFGAPCPFGGDSSGCYDRVDFEDTIVQDTFVIDGVAYTLQIVGFVEGTSATCTFDAGEVLEAFITAEQATNTACLFGRVLVAEPNITLTKTLDQTNPVPSGTNVSFTIQAQNTGSVQLVNVDLTDTLSIGGTCSTLTGPVSSTGGSLTAMAPGETWTYTCRVNGVTADFTNTATIEAVAYVNNRTIRVDATDTADVIVQQAQPGGLLVVTKSVNWRGAVPYAVEFEICVTGPSFPTPQCDLYSPEETIAYGNLLPGTYVVTETPPGTEWQVTNSPATVSVSANQTTFAMVINTLQRGSLTVQKVIDWGSATPVVNASFTICITGPSYPTGGEIGACQIVVGANGGQLTWNDLLPGTYTVSETPPGAEWTVTYAPETVVVPGGGSAAATVTNTNADDPTCDTRDLRLDLTGAILIEGATAIGTVTNNGDARCEYLIGMASYKKYNEVIDDQEIFAWVNPTVTIPAGETVSLSVGLPPCAAQVDLFYGEYLPNLAGVRYGERLLAAVHVGGADFCINTDTDGDGIDDAFDPDDDNDGLPDESDPAPLVFNDLDGDGIGDGVDEDLDGDGLPNADDPNPALFDDHDADGIGDGADEDDDNDGLADDADAEPRTFNDLDGDSIGDGLDDDLDGDGYLNEEEIAAGTNPADSASFPQPEATPEATSAP